MLSGYDMFLRARLRISGLDKLFRAGLGIGGFDKLFRARLRIMHMELSQEVPQFYVPQEEVSLVFCYE